ncbi:hypothetical protein [Meiothermus sp. CFH 77666]|uniref:hypothetical protein n=1 Tax=Meiothermus sp. CFH 77666 TaxID=2817942 RepID=UPI001AA08F67|nr:hypothetical protein [Meiothermus sp. CFH 77666]MBO1438657.1 hypothetical protein [Meiothermus sp. CFH 77666]
MDDLPLQKLAEQSNSKKADAERLAAEVTRLEVRYRREKAALQAELQAARERLGRVRYLVAQGAEPRAAEAEARGQVEALEAGRSGSTWTTAASGPGFWKPSESVCSRPSSLPGGRAARPSASSCGLPFQAG